MKHLISMFVIAAIASRIWGQLPASAQAQLQGKMTSVAALEKLHFKCSGMLYQDKLEGTDLLSEHKFNIYINFLDNYFLMSGDFSNSGNISHFDGGKTYFYDDSESLWLIDNRAGKYSFTTALGDNALLRTKGVCVPA